jgi:hypothetical protein
MKPFFIMLLLLVSKIQAQPYGVGVGAIFQNESPYLAEWIEHHMKNGVDHFWLYNHLSTDDFKTVLDPFIKRGIVEVVDWPYPAENCRDFNTVVCRAYKDCIQKSKDITPWCAFIDIDEFLFCPNGKSLKKNLASYADCAGVVVNWVMYGTSNVEKILPHEKLVDKLLFRSSLNEPVNLHVKTIVRPNKVIDCINPHFFIYKQNKTAVDENFQPVNGPFSSKNSVNVFRINHYWTRDKYYFYNHKLERQMKLYGNIDNALHLENLFNAVYDPILAY